MLNAKKRILITVLIIMLLSSCFAGCKKSNNPSDYFTATEIENLSQKVNKTEKTGTIIAYGGGFDKEDSMSIILKKSVEKSGISNPKVLFVPTGHRDNVEENEEIIEGYHNIGIYEIEILLVSKESKEDCAKKIQNADIIYATGGNLKFLTDNWSAKGVNEEIQKAFNRGAVLIGVSTGAMCWGQMGYDDAGDEKVFRVISSFPFLGYDSPYELYNASGILPFCICPHFDNIAWKSFNNTAKTLDIPSIAIDNSAAIVYQDGKFEILLEMQTRKVYLYYPDRGIQKLDVTKDTTILNLVDALRREQRD